MPDPSLLALTWRVSRRRLLASPPAIAAGLAYPALIAWIGLSDSYATASRFFIFLVPHVFLLAAQDTVRTDVESGALESVLFLGGRFRRFLAAKGLVLAAAAAGYTACLFVLLAAWGAVAGGLGPDLFLRFGLALVAGAYYAALAGVLSHFLKSGSNVLVVLLVQAGAVMALVFSTTARTGILDYAAAGRFPGLGPKLAFGALAAVLPNVIVSGRLPLFTAEVVVLLGLALLAGKRLRERLELRK